MVQAVTDLSVRQQAEAEVKAERNKKAVDALKVLLRKKAEAEQVVKNIDREIADYEAELAKQ